MPEKVTERAPGAPADISALLAEIARPPPRDAATDSGLLPGALVDGRFEIVRPLGRGGFAGVWEARDRRLRRPVALKILRSKRGRSAALGQNEAQAVARLAHHPNIVQIHDVGSSDVGAYLVLELLEGETLDARLAREPLPPERALEIAIEVAKALAHAHRSGVLHRDLKPSNVILTEGGGVKVLDFGLAQLHGGLPAPEGGTPGYMSPEQRQGEREDGRSDVYALGVLLHRMLAGRMPFDGDDEVRGPPALGGDVSPELAVLVQRMLSEDPDARPRDGDAALAELLRARDRAEPRRARRAPPASRRRTALALGTAALAVAWGVHPGRPAIPEPPPGERLVVAVADLANETGDRDLDALSGLLVTSLEQSRRLAVLTRSRMLDLAHQLGHPRVARVDEALGKEIARAAGARALLLGGIHRFGEVYALELRAVDPAGDTYLFGVNARAQGRAAIPDAVDRLSEAARRELRERAGDVAASRTRVAQSMTASLEAYRHYFEARHLDDSWLDAAGALAGYKRALEADPSFALPHLEIAILASWHEAPEEDPDWHMAEAARLAPRLPEKERRLVLAWKARQDGRHDEARALFRELVRDHPDDKEALYLAGETSWHGGGLDGAAEAAAYFRRALDLDPTFLVSMIHFLQWADRTGAREEAVTRARRAVQVGPGPMTLAMLARALAAAGDADAALVEAGRAVDLAGGEHFEASYALAEVLLWAGRRDEAEAELRRWIGPDVSSGVRRVALEFLPIALAAEGRRREALLALRELTGTGCARRCATFDETLKLHVLLAGGDLRAAREELARWQPPDEDELGPHLWMWPWLGLPAEGRRRAERLAPGSPWERRHAGAAALRAGDPEEAVAVLRELAPRDQALETEFLLGQALLAAGREREALVPLGKVVRAYPLYAPRWQASLRTWSLLLLARTHARLGEKAAARLNLARLMDEWQRADPDLPLLLDARALERQLSP